MRNDLSQGQVPIQAFEHGGIAEEDGHFVVAYQGGFLGEGGKGGREGGEERVSEPMQKSFLIQYR